MARAQQPVRVSRRRRTWGSGTRLRDEIVIPPSIYHGARFIRGLWRHRKAVTVLCLWGYLSSLLGSLKMGAIAVGVLVAFGLTVRLCYRLRGREATAMSFSETVLAARRRAKLLRQWPIACESAGLTGTSTGTAPRLSRLRYTGNGTLAAVVRCGRVGIPVPSVTKAAVTLAEVIGCREVTVTPRGSGVAQMAFCWGDPLGRVLRLAALPAAPEGRLAYGIRTDGTAATVIATQSVLLGGLTRTGKSNAVWALLADCLRQAIPVDLYVSDPKGGVELDALEPMVGQPARAGGLLRVREYATNPKDTVAMVEAAEKAMHARQHWMKRHGTRRVTPDHTNPLVVIILDETLVLADLLKKGADSPLGRIAYTGAAAGYVVWANTQVAQVDSLGRFRDLIPQRICFATPNPQVTDSVLGAGSEAAGAKCSTISTPGVGYSYADGDRTATKFRAVMVPDAVVAMVARGKLPGGPARQDPDLDPDMIPHGALPHGVPYKRVH